MSKKHRRENQQAVFSASGLSHEAEYRIIKTDLIKVIILNAFYLAAILLLYYSNLRSHFLDNWFAKVLHF